MTSSNRPVAVCLAAVASVCAVAVARRAVVSRNPSRTQLTSSNRPVAVCLAAVASVCAVALRRTSAVPGSRVLVVADGSGRDGVYLASLGHQVTTVELTQAGCALAADRARRSKVDGVLSIWGYLGSEAAEAHVYDKLAQRLSPKAKALVVTSSLVTSVEHFAALGDTRVTRRPDATTVEIRRGY